ncbi:MAG: cell division protein FtsA [Patescibacteria group bacterium]|nr:cell division protein FtsA [Patescibacteria group bacterium]MBU1683850.1 cell division protein FtsA [Patescibacteria group bacterium]MBU1778304.1 cell division protein FtsA [Patescibacteria group bacterium]MBU1987653.1 cell division protein FtsA [Patescibacteria group bacterium]MBU2474404.1 cell division protein FtsA [Patescibacteria group bacterium]
MKNNIISGLDIGSTAIRLVIGQKIDNKEKNLQIIGVISVPSKGISKGMITNIEDATSSISACVEKAERLTGMPINSVWAGINDPYIKCESSRGIIAVGKSDGEINEDDTARALESAEALSSPPNYDILDVIPIKYKVDDQENVQNPLGMYGRRLEVEALIIRGLSSQIKNLTKAIHRTGLDIDDLVLSPLAAGEVILDSKQKELGAVLINIGASTTSMAVYEEGELMHTAILPIGSEYITKDLAIGLQCPIDFAEKIKIEYGNVNPEQFSKKDEIDPSVLIKDESVSQEIGKISKQYVAKIIKARSEEIFEKADKELKKIERSRMLPAGVFLTGGGAKLNNLVGLAKKELGLPVVIGTNKNIDTIIDKVNSPEFLTSLGLVVWGADRSSQTKDSKIKYTVKKIKEWILSLKP